MPFGIPYNDIARLENLDAPILSSQEITCEERKRRSETDIVKKLKEGT
jgi:hypothetical protein